MGNKPGPKPKPRPPKVPKVNPINPNVPYHTAAFEDPEWAKRFLNYLKGSNTVEATCAVMGLPAATYQAWVDLGLKKPDSHYAAFLERVNEAIGESQSTAVMNLRRHANGIPAQYLKHPEGAKDSKGRDISGQLMYDRTGKPIVAIPAVKPDWKADAWVLARRHPRVWSQTKKLELSGPNGAPIETVPLSVDDLKARLAADLKAMESCGDE